MDFNMKKQFYFLFVLIISFLLVSCGSKKTGAYYSYETECLGVEYDGSQTLRTWANGRNAQDAFEQAHKKAVYDVIFNGIKKGSGDCGLKPLVLEVNARERHEDYFNRFFSEHGDYRKFSSIKDKRVLSSKYSKTHTQTMCETTVCVWRNKIKEKLIEDGIIK